MRLTLGSRAIELRSVAVGIRAVLPPGEAALALRGKSEKRRDEFVAGRVAAREAVIQFSGAPFEVLARTEGDDSGRPIVVPSALGISVSISHASGVAVAVAAVGSPLGVDVEPVSLSPDPSFADEAFSGRELERWPSLPLAWAAKEAVLKVWGVGLRAPLGLVSLTPHDFRYGAPFEIAIEGEAVGERQCHFLAWAEIIDSLVVVIAQ